MELCLCISWGIRRVRWCPFHWSARVLLSRLMEYIYEASLKVSFSITNIICSFPFFQQLVLLPNFFFFFLLLVAICRSFWFICFLGLSYSMKTWAEYYIVWFFDVDWMHLEVGMQTACWLCAEIYFGSWRWKSVEQLPNFTPAGLERPSIWMSASVS